MRKSLVLIVVLLVAVLGVSAEVVPSVDVSSTYQPTKIINGDFSTKPWINVWYGSPAKLYTSYDDTPAIPNNLTNLVKEYNGIDGGWNTTEIETYSGNYFEWMTGPGVHGNSYQGYYIDMNVHDAAVLWQDLTTYGGDVIRWTLNHGASKASTDSTQAMRVEIGAPKRDNNKAILPSTGYGVNNTDSVIVEETKAKYTATTVTGTYGFANTSELANLSVINNDSGWYTAKGVYVVPKGQSVTRFAFISEAPNPGCGNELANVTFSTLVGNLSAVQNMNGSLTVKGYWGDEDASKCLCIRFAGSDEYLKISMAKTTKTNFTVTIPSAAIPGSGKTIEVFHEDYESAKVSIPVGYLIAYAGLDGATFTSNTNPKNYHEGSDEIVLENPTKDGWYFTGWSGTGLSGNFNMTVTIPQGSSGDRYYTAHFSQHQHHWVYGLSNDGKSLTAYCDSNDEYAYICEYNDPSKSIVLEMVHEYKKQLSAFVNSDATIKTVSWKSMNEAVVKIDEDGLLTGVGPGTAEVRAYSDDGSDFYSSVNVSILN